MRAGIMIAAPAGAANAVDALVAQAGSAADAGLAAVWLPQLLDVDALTALAVIGREVPGVALGTAVVPTFPRHPIALASQAQTVHAATGRRLHLGIGLSHRHGIEHRFGYSFDRPVRHLREYLTALTSLLHTGSVDLHGETLTATTGRMRAAVAGATPPPPVLVAALGPQLLRVTGELADGTLTWMVGPKTLEGHIVPTIAEAAAGAGRQAPRVVVGLPVCVTGDTPAARERAAAAFGHYQEIPSYRAMLERESATAAEIAVIGDEEAVSRQLRHLIDAGATEIVAATRFGTAQEQARTLRLLGALGAND